MSSKILQVAFLAHSAASKICIADMFGNVIFKERLESSHKNFKKITALEQLAYFAKPGMGALKYILEKNMPHGRTML